MNACDYLDTGLPFGRIKLSKIAEVTLESVERTQRAFLKKTGFDPDIDKTVINPFDEEISESLVRYLEDIGALYSLNLRQLWKDIPKTHMILESNWACLWHAMWLRDMSPTKHLRRIGFPSYGHTEHIPGMKDHFYCIYNNPYRDELWKLAKCKSEDDLRTKLFGKLDYIRKTEEEYRENALLIAQVGIGYMGLVLGGIFFGLSCILTIITFLLSVW
jgi:hypothetical protein